MPVTLGGMASGLNTDDIIKKLVQVEARPIIQWEQEKIVFNKKKKALYELRDHVNNINKAAQDLYGFRATFNNKKALSSNNDVFDAVANKLAQNGTHSLEVVKLASTHKLSSDPIDKKKTIPAGRFSIEVNGVVKKIRFRGGTLKSLHDEINTSASDIVSTSHINTVGDKYILTIESLTPGKKGEIRLKGDIDFMNEIGLVKGLKDQEKETAAIVFNSKYFVTYSGKQKPEKESGNIQVGKDGKSVSLTGVLWRDYVLPTRISVKKNTVIEFQVAYTKPGEEPRDDHLPFRVETGPVEKTVIKGIDLESYNVSRIRPLKKAPPRKPIEDVMGIGVVTETKGERKEKLYPIGRDFKGKMELPIGKDFAGRNISKIVFYSNEGTSRFSDAVVNTPIEGTGILEPKNQIREASDAKLKVDGIEVTREKNEGLNDVIRGVTLKLKSTSKGPVELKVSPDMEISVEKIKKFVEAYNKYLEFNRQVMKAERSTKPGEFNRSKSKTGIFMSDVTLMRLENNLKTIISNAYPSRAENPIKVLPLIGISTGAINASWETIRLGKLVVDEIKLKDVIRQNPEGVEQFFGSDIDGDNRIDNGMAFRIQAFLKPYISSGRNIISSKIEMEDNNIKLADKRIDRHQEHLKRYEDKLRKKFATMEKSLSGAKAQQKWLKNQLKGLQGSEEK